MEERFREIQKYVESHGTVTVQELTDLEYVRIYGAERSDRTSQAWNFIKVHGERHRLALP